MNRRRAQKRRRLLKALIPGLLVFLCVLDPAGQQPGEPPTQVIEEGPYYKAVAGMKDGIPVMRVDINGPPEPPAGFTRSAAALPEPNVEAGINVLSGVPAFDWSFGCSATSAAMIAGYYDRTGFPNMYAGPTNGGVMPLDNSSWPYWYDGHAWQAQCPLSATHNGLDGRTTRGNVDDYWVQYNATGPDPYVGNWTEHTHGNCTGDFMGTNQWKWTDHNKDGSTNFWYYIGGSKWTGTDADDGGYGLQRFYESRGYTVVERYNRVRLGYDWDGSGTTYSPATQGATFADYKAEIDAGRPVMVQLKGHTMVGVGYDDSTNTMYIHDTWDYSTHTMTWGGSYGYMEHMGITIVRLSAAAHTVSTPTAPSGSSSGNTGQSLSYSTGGSTCNQGHAVQYRFDWDDGTYSSWSSSTSASKSWSAAGSYHVLAQARCATTTSIVSSWSSAKTVTISQPHTVSTPTVPSGPSSGLIGTSLAYSTGSATCSQGHAVQYRFNWDDGTYSSWSSSTSASKSWSAAGSYHVLAQARCATTTSIVSSWSSAKTVTISQPHTVSTPSVPSGPSAGLLGTALAYSTGSATCSQGHSVQYRFDWGDGTYSTWGSATSASKSWSAVGTYQVKAQARCATTTSVVSSWSSAKSVQICVIPSAPTGVSATDGTYGDRVRVSWTAVSGATRYEVYRAAEACGTYTKVGESTTISYDNTTVTALKVYWYKVKACNACGCSAYSGVNPGYAGTPGAGTAAVFRVDQAGNVRADGAVYGQCFYGGSADVAEWITVSEPVEPGDVLELDPWNPGHYRKAVGPCSSLVAGVVSTEPALSLGGVGAEGEALLALVGMVPVKACDENGPILAGDLVVVSSTPGYVMRWDGAGACSNLVGKALESLDGPYGVIRILLTR